MIEQKIFDKALLFAKENLGSFDYGKFGELQKETILNDFEVEFYTAYLKRFNLNNTKIVLDINKSFFIEAYKALGWFLLNYFEYYRKNEDDMTSSPNIQNGVAFTSLQASSFEKYNSSGFGREFLSIKEKATRTWVL